MSIKIDPYRALGALCKRSYYRFFIEMWETIEAVELVDNWHIKYICDELQDAYERWERCDEAIDIIINVPPASSKSTIIAQLFPAWLWVKNPSIRVMSASYSDTLSVSHASKTRDCLKSWKFNRCYPNLIEFKKDTDGKSHYKTLQKGERYATSTRGTATGFHADFIILDDILNAQDSESDAGRESASNFLKTVASRKTDRNRTVTILVMQRLHTEDPTALMLKNTTRKINHIVIPAELSEDVKPKELIQNYIDGLMDANRLNRSALDDFKTRLGSYGYAGQFMQTPAPQGGSVWQKWFVEIDDNEFPTPSQMTDYGTDWDTAYTDKETNSASAFVTSGKIGNRMYIDNFGFFYVEFPELIRRMTSLPAPHYVEAKASGKTAKQTLVHYGIQAIEVQVESDKMQRARTATPSAEAGMIYIRKSLADKLYNDPQQGVLFFPKAKADVADALAQAIIRQLVRKRYEVSNYDIV